ncbi:hypothetical protein KRX51_05265 [Corynebacterium sp. TAE3-ERU12]|uniref:class I SAM-dependent RNA methyltransferase n=1 Tax=Corynebacterium sp. TAE3-ERU12 TaxID=2849491 RepID=UPI001C479240|nr:hypothetical protein [Corynebacterium sp. TAE3-ERU12]MBV7295330.1 hypothetical protein [Corynebacterium sp. TAE3-ERU12]
MTEAPGATADIRIDRPAQGGEFIGTLDGRIVLVRGAMAGEVARVRFDDPNAKLLRGAAEDILEPSSHRVDTSCPAARAGAGCCDWAYIDNATAIRFKAAIIADALRRIGRFTAAELPDVIDSTSLKPSTGWRTRVRLGVDDNGRAGLRKRHSRDLVVATGCTQVVDGLLDGVGTEGFCPPGGELHAVIDADGARHVMHRAAPERGVRGAKGKRPAATVIEGTPTAEHIVAGRRFEVAVDGFWQAHSGAAQYYYDRVLNWLTPATGATAWDLYGGVGVLAAALAQIVGDSGHVDSVEAAPSAAPAGTKALTGLPVTMHTARVENCVAKLAETSAPRIVVLDPPRTGAGNKVISQVSAAGPEQVMHIGCDPATFARDLRSWADHGYRIDRLEAIDAFPNTHHVEAIALLHKK